MKRIMQLLPIALLAGMSLPAHAETGLYVGGSIGSSHVDDDFRGLNIDTDTNAYRLFGGLKLGDSLGIEAGYLNFGDLTETIDVGGIVSRTDVSRDGWTLAATLGMPLSDNLSLFGRGGVFFWDADITINGFSIDTPGDENPFYGAGLKLDLSDRFSMVGDWTRYDLDTLETDVISLGFEYRFGY